MPTKNTPKKKTVKSVKKEAQVEELVTIKQFVKARKLPGYFNEILGNYIHQTEHEGFPKTVKRTIAEWDAVYSKMNNEKA